MIPKDNSASNNNYDLLYQKYNITENTVYVDYIFQFLGGVLNVLIVQ